MEHNPLGVHQSYLGGPAPAPNLLESFLNKPLQIQFSEILIIKQPRFLSPVFTYWGRFNLGAN